MNAALQALSNSRAFVDYFRELKVLTDVKSITGTESGVVTAYQQLVSAMWSKSRIGHASAYRLLTVRIVVDNGNRSRLLFRQFGVFVHNFVDYHNKMHKNLYDVFWIYYIANCDSLYTIGNNAMIVYRRWLQVVLSAKQMKHKLDEIRIHRQIAIEHRQLRRTLKRQIVDGVRMR